MSQSDNSDYNEYDYDDFEFSHPPPNKKYRVTPIVECTESDLLPPTILGTLLPIPPPPKPETKQSIQQLLAPYKAINTIQNTKIYHPRISVIKHKHHNHHKNHKDSFSASSTISRAPSECIKGYITIYDIPDSCWSLIFHFCNVCDLVFNIASTNKFFQSLVIDQSAWIHRTVILPSAIYHKSLKQKIENTLESMFLNWTSLKQLDIMLDPDTDPQRLTFIWRMLCTPRPKIEILRIGNSISLPGGDLCAVNETAFKYLKLIQDIQVIDFSFNMFCVSYEAIIDFFAAQAGQIYNAPPKPKRSYLSQWCNKQKANKLNRNNKDNEEESKHKEVQTKPQIPLKRRNSLPLNFTDDEDSDNHTKDDNHNTNNSKRSVLGKRRRERSTELSPKKKRKTTKSLKREMDSEDDEHNNNNDKRLPIKSQTYPHFTRRKRRRTTDTLLIRRSLHDDMNKLRKKKKTKSDSKQELSASPPPSNIKKILYQKRKPSLLANHKRHRMRLHSSPIRRKYRLDTYQQTNHDNYNANTPKIKKEVAIPKEFNYLLSSTPSPITSPIINQEAFSSSIYGKKVRKTILSNIDPSLMSTLKDLNNDELELNLSLTLNIDSIDIGLNDNDNMNSFENDNDKYYESYRENLSSDYLHIDRKKDSMKDLGLKSKLRRIYFREVCMKSFPDLAYNYLNTKRIESLSLYTGDTSSLIAFIDKCGTYPIIKKIEIDGTSPFRWRCAPLCEALSKCINLCSIQLPSIVDAVDIIAFDSFVNAAVNLTEIGLVTGDRQLFKPIHDVINKHGFKMDINPSGLRFIFARRKNKPKLREKYMQNKKQFLQRKRSNTY